MFLRNRQEGLGAIETIIVCIVLSFVMVILLGNFHQISHKARETAIKTGLREIRASLSLYRAMNQNQNPGDLRDLISGSYLLTSPTGTLFEKHFLDSYSTDARGYPIDPFGHRYQYDPQNGEVWSNTQGYEKW